MPDRKYKTPNGQIVKESELQAKYGDRFSSLIQDKTFSEVTEPVYKTPNGKYEAESVLKGKYGDKFEELSKNNTFVLDLPAQKKNPVATSTSNGPKLESVQTVGSSGGVKQNRALNALNTNNKIASSIPKSTSFRLPNDNDFKIMQLQGKVAPNSELKLKKVQNPDDLYNLKSDGTPVPKPKQKSITQTHWNDFNAKPFKVATIDSNNKTASTISKDVKFRLPDGYVQKPIADNPQQTEELYNFTEKHKATLRKEIDDKIEDNDLDLDYPYLYYSTFDKSPEINQNTQLLEEKPKDNFIERTFGEEKLKQLNINVADFDGFLNKKGYKNEFLDKEEKGLFNGAGTGKESYDISLAKEIQKKRLLSLYMGEINGRSLAKTKLEAEKRNLEKAGRNAEVIDDIEGTTPFDNDKFKEYIEAEMPNLAKKTKEVEVENKEIYAKHKSGEADLLYGTLYGTEKFFKKFGYGFLDKVNQIATTIYDKIGADERAQGLRFLNEERQISRPNTREVGYAKGLTTKSDGRDYLFTEDGRVIDQELKIDVTDLLEKYQYEGIKYSAKEEKKSDYTFSPQGSIMQFGGVAGDMIVQYALQKGVGGIASKATNLIPSLSKIPLSKGMSSSIISQSALGYTQGANETYKLAIDAGINEKEARLISNEAGQKIGLLYAFTAPLSPQTKATQAIFGAEGKELIKKAILSYSKIGKKGFLETLQSGLSSLPRNAVNWIEEGLIKEFPQELIQQGAETYLINPTINNQAGQELKKETMSGEEVVNTLIQTVASGGLAVIPDLFSKTDKLQTLGNLSKDLKFESNINEMVTNGIVKNEQANILKKDVKTYTNQINKIPKNLNKNIAMDVMSDLEDISQLELKKKGIDKSFHEEIDAEIEAKRTGIRDRINFVGLSKKEIATLKETASDELIAEAKEQGKKEFKFDNKQITERANKIYLNQIKDEVKSETTVAETEPQAEVQKPSEAEKVNDATSDAENEVVKLQQEIDSFNDEYNTLADAVNAENRTLNTPKSENEIKLNKLQDKLNALRDKRDKLKQKEETSPVEDVVATSVEKPLSSQEENVSMDNNLRKEKQLEIINKSNPAPNSHNTWVRTVDDIKEAKDVFETAFNDGEMYPDFTVDDMKESLDSGEITIHSSRPIKNGSFVTPSRMNAEEYAGGKGSKIYSKTIKINDVAWIDESEGQYAPVKETKNAKTPPTNPPADADVRIEPTNVGESGNAKPKSNSKSSVPSSVDGGEVKGDIEVVKERINPKKEADKADKEADGFKREKGKSSVLKRIREGGNSDNINEIIDKIGLNYKGRKQEQVYADGVNFVKEVGIAEAYNAIKNGELKDSDTINVVYATILQEFPKMVENEMSKVSDPEELNSLVQELDDFHQKIYTEFKAKTIDSGRGSAILNFIYNQDLKIRYSLSQQIENFKKVNNGVVPAETLSKMKELDKQYKEANKRIEELENLLKEAQEQQDFQNIIEEEKRVPKISKTKREKADKIIKALDDFEKSILKNSYSDATMITPILIQGIRATKLAINQGVNISEAIEKGIEGIKKELEKIGKSFENEELFRNDLNKSLENSGVDLKQPKVTVDKNGKVRIPSEMIKDFASKGGTDLSEFAKQLQESIKDEFPDVSVRNIRESVSNYGKKANKSRPKIVADIQKLKSEERLRLEYEDLQNRITKEKNEIRKRELSQTQKRLKEQIKQLQDDLGITEEERTNRSVNYTKKRIEQLREKIKNNDFAKKEIKPIVESPELKQAKIEKNRIQEEFDYLSYQQELENRTLRDKIKQFGSDMYDSQRVTLATGEMSFVGAQGGLYMVDSTFSRKTLKNLIENFKGTTIKDWKSNPIGTALKVAKSAHSAESLIKMFNTMGTANNYVDFQRLLKEDANYDVYLKSGLRLLGEDVKSQVKDDNFIGNNILTLLKIPIHLTDRIEKKESLNFKLKLANEAKKRTTLQGYYERLKNGESSSKNPIVKIFQKFKSGNTSDKNKKTATEIFSNVNPLSTFERGNSVFMNMARVEMFNKYAAALYASGKNPIDHLDDFKKLASAVNTVTGSGNMNQTITMALPILNKLMFSASYFAASWNLTPPFSAIYLWNLGNYDNFILENPKTWKNIKATPAQKAFVKPMVKGFIAFYAASLFTMAMINAAIDDDDEMTEEEKAKKRAYIEYDPRSSDFMQVISGNVRTDYFGPYRGNVVLMSKLLSGQTKTKSGEIIENGSKFGSRTDFQIATEYLAGKSNPFPGMFIRYSMGKKEEVTNEETGEKENRRMLYDDRVGIDYQIKHNTIPIFAKTVNDVFKEDPVLGAEFYTALALFGKQTNIYQKSKNSKKNSRGRSSRSGRRNR